MSGSDGKLREPYAGIAEWLESSGVDLLNRRSEEAEAIFRRIGITFAVYGEGGDPERLIPFDLIPRVFAAAEWRRLDRGIRQRARALNAFLYDVYHRGEILRACEHHFAQPPAVPPPRGPSVPTPTARWRRRRR